MQDAPYRIPAPIATSPLPPPTSRQRWLAKVGLLTSAVCFGGGIALFVAFVLTTTTPSHAVLIAWIFVALAIVQLVAGVVGTVAAVRLAVWFRRANAPGAGVYALSAVTSTLLALAGFFGLPIFVILATVDFSGIGGAWGRPLRVDGNIVHPGMTRGSAWTSGPAPALVGLTAATREVLAALWLHDAKKEHGSVPAFARVAWMLVGVGAPSDLVMRAHGAAMEEIDHTCRCFALVAAYLGYSLEPRPMRELFVERVVPKENDALTSLAIESLVDGCLLEDYNADLAEESLRHVQDSAVRAMVVAIARDERSHGELAWDVLAWALRTGGEKVISAIRDELEKLPTQSLVPYGPDFAPRVAAAQSEALRAHGRVPIESWQPLYDARRAVTLARARTMVDACARAVTTRLSAESTRSARSKSAHRLAS